MSSLKSLGIPCSNSLSVMLEQVRILVLSNASHWSPKFYTKMFEVVYKIPYRRARLAFRPSARASKGILHTKFEESVKKLAIFPLDFFHNE